jgi:predicted NUDIX family NTP pyrophosphohydrolase
MIGFAARLGPMSAKISAGLLMYRDDGDGLLVFLVHPGGPFFRTKDAGVWTIPKGLPEPDEPLLDAAVREFREETGLEPAGPYQALGTIQQRGGKVVHAWAFRGAWQPDDAIRSNTFELEWPPRSGRRRSFPEVDRAELLGLSEARAKINPAQVVLIDRLEALVAGRARVGE